MSVYRLGRAAVRDGTHALLRVRRPVIFGVAELV
jgi:hypothetical protein